VLASLTKGFQSAMQRPAPNASRPDGDQSAAVGFRLAPIAINSVSTCAMVCVWGRDTS
jgi:hypothetical protein